LRDGDLLTRHCGLCEATEQNQGAERKVFSDNQGLASSRVL
jgi:hypothetical protein